MAITAAVLLPVAALLACIWAVYPELAGPFTVVVLLLVGLPFFLKYPLTAAVVVLFVSQEILLERQWLMTLGSDLYFREVLGAPPVLVMGLFAWLVAAQKGSDTDSRAPIASIVQVALALMVVAFTLAGVQAVLGGMSLFNAARQVVYPMIALLVFLDLARRRFATEAKALLLAGGITTVVLALLGLVVAAQTGDSFVFYDSATAFIALAVICVVFLCERLRMHHAIVLICAVAIILLSNRRSIVIGMLVALIILAIARRGAAVRTRIVFGTLMGLGVLSLIAAPALALTLERLEVGVNTIRGLDADASTEEHATDLTIGFSHALDRIGGYGASALQLPGLAAERSRHLYVHNEFLQLWLKHGVIVAILFSVAMLLIVTLAFKSSSRPLECPPAQWALARGIAAVWPALLVAQITAPFFTTTTRWPAILGIMVALVSASVTAHADRREEPSIGSRSH